MVCYYVKEGEFLKYDIMVLYFIGFLFSVYIKLCFDILLNNWLFLIQVVVWFIVFLFVFYLMVFNLYFYDNFMKFGIENFFVFKNKLNNVVIEIIGNFIEM